MNQEGLFQSLSEDFSDDVCKKVISKHRDTVFVEKLNVFHNFIEKLQNIYNQKRDPGFIQGKCEMLAALVTPDIEELFVIPNQEVSIVPKVANILNVVSANNIDGLKNESTTNYKTRSFITITDFLLRIVVDTISSSKKSCKK